MQSIIITITTTIINKNNNDNNNKSSNTYDNHYTFLMSSLLQNPKYFYSKCDPYHTFVKYFF